MNEIQEVSEQAVTPANGASADVLAELRREKRVVETLYRVAQTVARKDDLREIVQAVTDETTAITGAQFGAFFYNVVGRDGAAYSLYTISGVPREQFERFPMPRATAIFRPTFEGTGSVRLEDVRADPRFGRNAPHNGLPPGHLPVRSYLAVPVFGRAGDVVGGLFFGHERAGVFTEEHEQIAAGIATQAGLAIEKARLLAAEREARAEAEARGDAALALEFVEDGVVMVDDAGIVRLWNRAAERITGLAADAVLGRAIGEAVPGWERIVLAVPVGEQTEPVAPQTLPLDTLRGRELWISVYGVAFHEGTVYAFRDVSDQRALETVRAEVIATVSHELRTPVAAVYGVAETMRRRELAPEVRGRLLDVLYTESERLRALVDEILQTSQVDSGKVRVSLADVDPMRAVTEIARSASLGGDRVEIVVEADGAVPAVVADEEKLRQVLANLLDNAVKYGAAAGDATVVVRLLPRASTVRFEVADRGGGVPRHERARIFEKFYRLDPHLKEGVRGTGLGLYIARELVARMDGTIGVESTEGAGATFWFELPRSWAR